MRDNVGLNDRESKFVSLVAGAEGELSVAECYRRAGFAGDTSNAHKKKKHLAEFIAAERSKLGLPPIGEEEESNIDDGDKAELLREQRKLYALAMERGEIGPAQKCLRAIERLLRKPGSPGRPASPTTTAPVPRENMFAHMSPEEFTALVDLILELPPIDEEAAERLVHD